MGNEELTNLTKDELIQLVVERDQAVKDAEKRIDLLVSELKLERHKKYGRTSEKLSEGQIELFVVNEIEAIADSAKDEDDTLETITYKRRKPKEKRRRTLDDSNLEEVFVDIELPEDERICPCCGGELHDIGVETSSTLEVEPVRYYKRTRRIHKYACRTCEHEHRGQTIVKASAEPALIPGSFASPSVVAHLMTEKYVCFVPLDRQERVLAHEHIYLSKQTMSNWMIACSDAYLEPLYDLLHKDLVAQDIVMADETPMKILHPVVSPEEKTSDNSPPGKPPSSKSCHIWVYRTSKFSDKQIIMYDHRATRSGACAHNFLRGHTGYVQCDGYSGYNKVGKDIKLAGCWAHARRKFHDAYVLATKGTREYECTKQALAYFAALFKLERKFEKLNAQQRYLARAKESTQVLSEFRKWAEANRNKVRPNTKCGEAFTYLFNQWGALTVFLEDGRIELSNNASERSVKQAVMLRKNSLFVNTMSGAKSSSIILSIVETAKANKLSPESYLRFLFETVPSTPISELPELLPWGNRIPESVRSGYCPPERKKKSLSK